MDPPARLKNLWKGKSKAESQDFGDLNPTITYRHIFAQNLGVKDPLRVIALCDSDAFYAACEMIRLGIDKDTPLVVLQWDSLIAVNYPARKYGISRMAKLDPKEVKTRYPDLVVVHVATYKEGASEPGYWDNVDTKTHKVSLDYYRRESEKVAGMFRACLPDCEIEKASIDEAFFDFTRPVREILLQRYPYLAHVPPDAPHGLDTALPPPPPVNWDNIGCLIPTDPASSEGHKDAKALEDDSTMTWHDVALSIAAELMAKARDEVYVNLGYSTSAGIARNKFLAKLSASYKKPNSQSILRNIAIPGYLKPMPFQKIRFLGGKLGKAYAETFNAVTVEDLLLISAEEMQRRFGENSVWVHELLRGIDRSEVKEKPLEAQSMLASKNLPKPITDASEGFHWIRILAAELALRINQKRQTSPNLWPKSVVLHTRQGYENGRSKQAPFPSLREITVDTIASAGDKLWKELVGTGLVMKVTNVQLALTGISVAEPGQQSIEGFLKTTQPSKRPRGLDGSPRVESSHLPGSTDNRLADKHSIPVNDLYDEPQSNSSFTCMRCGKKISIPPEILNVEGLRDETLGALRREHDDFHFAQDLAKQPGNTTLMPGRGSKSPQKKKRRSEPQGIEKFLSRP